MMDINLYYDVVKLCNVYRMETFCADKLGHWFNRLGHSIANVNETNTWRLVQCIAN